MKNNLITTSTRSLFAALVVGSTLFLAPVAQALAGGITRAEIEAAQQRWCDGLLSVSKAHRTGGDPRAVASAMLSELYNVDQAEILFKPTLTFGERTFRPTKEAALAYFVGGNPAFPEDTGFALLPFEKASFRVHHIFSHGDVAIAVGKVTLTDTAGVQTTVDKSFGYLREADGDLKIVLHHSSLPFQPAK